MQHALPGAIAWRHLREQIRMGRRGDRVYRARGRGSPVQRRRRGPRPRPSRLAAARTLARGLTAQGGSVETTPWQLRGLDRGAARLQGDPGPRAPRHDACAGACSRARGGSTRRPCERRRRLDADVDRRGARCGQPTARRVSVRGECPRGQRQRVQSGAWTGEPASQRPAVHQRQTLVHHRPRPRRVARWNASAPPSATRPRPARPAPRSRLRDRYRSTSNSVLATALVRLASDRARRTVSSSPRDLRDQPVPRTRSGLYRASPLEPA
jgi:hypothetical protein